MGNLLSLDYWFGLQPPFFTGVYAILLLVLFAGLLVAGIAILLMSGRLKTDKWGKRLWGKIGWFGLVMGASGLMMYAIAYEQVPVLSMRFGYIVWILGAGVWKYSLWRYATKVIPAKRAMAEERQAYEKWLPKSK